MMMMMIMMWYASVCTDARTASGRRRRGALHRASVTTVDVRRLVTRCWCLEQMTQPPGGPETLERGDKDVNDN